uniref:Transposable element protein, putative, MuDR n=1 Tax=Oryza sativa subsp. japonica TaxID=39947 RepID=Q2QQI7_ORYSJ|nr:Transposable element protein, putative, MuDR [Oryza sativa Japonica Group]
MGLNDVLGWLYNMFGVDLVPDKFVINVVWPIRGQHGWQWRVVEVASTGSWRKFVSKVREKGYSLSIVVQKTKRVDRSGESSHAVVEEIPLEGAQAENVWRTEQGRGEEVVEGNTQAEVIVCANNREANDSDDEEPESPMRVDAAEENEAVVDQMEVENEEYIALVVEGEDTTLWDKETNIPDDWTTILMSRMKVKDGLDAHWRFDSKQVQVGQMFHDKGHLQDAVKRWAFDQKREFRVKISNRTTYDVKCTQAGCPWRVHGYKPQHDTLWVAARVEQHTCLLENTRLVHRNMTAAFVAQMVYSKVVRKTFLSPFTIMHDVEKEYGYVISYDKAWRAKQKALEMRKRRRATKCFTEWVEFEPMEKWSLLHDTDGLRYGVITTNLAEVYNWVMKNTRPLPLVAILEGITRGTQKYLCKRYSMASLNLSKPSVKYSLAITQYMDEKSQKGGMHRVRPAGNRELLFEIRLSDKSGVGIGTTDITLECMWWPKYRACKCNCNKPYLLHRPCSHVLAASAKGGVDANLFVSPYFTKEAWEATWRGELRGWRAVCDCRDRENCLFPNASVLIPVPGKAGVHHTNMI